ncbi:hypothetical protein mRhiFer1_008611 [Rhinolophus ferrumequinum]|uniref:Uncharacterized protein n=1 Tax=Rhinolophus ferrumequinum TaxID=59479 RepID=A0A7J7U100_RHIFE|nr:hypothetical protein mRhiFer1_008611 [Rhinolophus ferrumequinum]
MAEKNKVRKKGGEEVRVRLGGGCNFKELRPERGEGGPRWFSGGRVFQREPACAKALRQDQAWHVGGIGRRPMCLEQSEQGGDREEVRAGRGQGRLCRVSWAWRKIWTFTLRQVGAQEGCGQRRGGT